MGRRRTATSADDVDQPLVEHDLDLARKFFGRLRVAALLVGQSGVRVARDETWGYGRQPAQPRQQTLGSEAAVQSYGQRLGMEHRCGERLDRLSAEASAAGIADGEREHDFGKFVGRCHFVAHLHIGTDGGLGVERVEDGLHEDDVGTLIGHYADLCGIGGLHLVEGDAACGGVVHVLAHREHLARRPQGGDHEARFGWVIGRKLITQPTRQTHRCTVHLLDAVA